MTPHWTTFRTRINILLNPTIADLSTGLLSVQVNSNVVVCVFLSLSFCVCVCALSVNDDRFLANKNCVNLTLSSARYMMYPPHNTGIIWLEECAQFVQLYLICTHL